MHLFLRCNETHPVEVGAVKVSDLKPLFEAAENIPADQLTLYYAGTPLEDDWNVDECLQDGMTVEATVGLLGGKVHGSLARAGKVKGQTPKVEKQEKRKKKTGRAKRRMQFNRRFVNVVVTFGRKKGPNSNS